MLIVGVLVDLIVFGLLNFRADELCLTEIEISNWLLLHLYSLSLFSCLCIKRLHRLKCT